MAELPSHLASFYRFLIKQLELVYPSREAQAVAGRLIEHRCQIAPGLILLSEDRYLSDEIIAMLSRDLSRLQDGEPLQYILGEAYFYDRNFFVAPGVLIPRGETEELVHWIREDQSEKDHALTLLDIGTGSGIISISLALELNPKPLVQAIDISSEALAIAKKNAQLLGADVNFKQIDIFEASPQEYHALDLIVSNPPYVTESEQNLMTDQVLEHEPHEALFVPDEDALRFYRQIARLAKEWLIPGGWLYLEINEAMGKETCDLLAEYSYKDILLRKDLNGKDRMIRARL